LFPFSGFGQNFCAPVIFLNNVIRHRIVAPCQQLREKKSISKSALINCVL